MKPDPLTLETEAQQVLNDLLSEGLIPFTLNVGKITKASSHYTIHFHDSRMRTADVPLTPSQSWAEMVRIAVLARVAKLSGPLKK
jgi:hypothetical protein